MPASLVRIEMVALAPVVAIYCDGRAPGCGGSGHLPSVTEQIKSVKTLPPAKADKFIAYFQTFTNTLCAHRPFKANLWWSTDPGKCHRAFHWDKAGQSGAWCHRTAGRLCAAISYLAGTGAANHSWQDIRGLLTAGIMLNNFIPRFVLSAVRILTSVLILF